MKTNPNDAQQFSSKSGLRRNANYSVLLNTGIHGEKTQRNAFTKYQNTQEYANYVLLNTAEILQNTIHRNALKNTRNTLTIHMNTPE